MEGGKIRVHADPDIADEIPWYLGLVKGYTEAIGTALDKADFEAIRDVGHRMKGSGESFGFAPISEMGKSLEQAAKERNGGEIQKKLGELSRYLEAVEVVYE